MTGSPRTLGLFLLLAGFAAPPVAAQDIQEMFTEGVGLLNRGRDQEALNLFQRILAEDPSQEQAYELWKAADAEVFLDILTKEGEYELFAKHMMELARQGRSERKNDAEAMRGLVDSFLGAESGAQSRLALRQLAADHGEYAVPLLVPYLADSSDDDRRVRVMQALTEMGDDVVLPLIEATRSEDVFLRRNVGLVLGYIGDQRASAALKQLAEGDADPSVSSAAQSALARMGASEDSALEDYLRQGDDYYQSRQTVLRPYQVSSVVWNWDGSGLASADLRGELYNDELAKRSFSRALEVDPDSLLARAGLVRAYVSQRAKLRELQAIGQDVSDLQDWISSSLVTIHLAGEDAVDAALQSTVASRDSRTSSALCRMLGSSAGAVTPGLAAALASDDAATRSEAAVAMGRISVASGEAVPAEAVQVLGEAAGREVSRIVAVIDANAERANGLVAALTADGYQAYAWNSGTRGLSMLKRVAGVDLILVGDEVADLTTFQVLDELARDPRTEGTTKVVLSSLEDAEDLYGEKANAVMDGSDMAAIQGAASGDMNADRAEADALAVHAASSLSQLARSGADISGATAGLVATLANRPDEVVVPALEALGFGGGEAALAAIASVVGNGDRSDEARSAAARAAAGIFRRGATPAPEAVEAMFSVLGSDAGQKVQNAVALALGKLPMDAGRRAAALRSAAVEAK